MTDVDVMEEEWELMDECLALFDQAGGLLEAGTPASLAEWEETMAAAERIAADLGLEVTRP